MVKKCGKFATLRQVTQPRKAHISQPGRRKFLRVNIFEKIVRKAKSSMVKAKRNKFFVRLINNCTALIGKYPSNILSTAPLYRFHITERLFFGVFDVIH
jgi:hypothetical protein